MKMLLSLLFCLAVGAQAFTTYDWTTHHPEGTTDYQTEPVQCDYVIAGESGEIKSPNYPFSYPNNLNCSWKIEKPATMSTLKIVDFELEETGGCQFDYMKITIGTGSQVMEIGPYCGMLPPVGIEFSDEVTVNLVTDSSVQKRGIYLYFEPTCQTEKPSGGSTVSTDFSSMSPNPETGSTAHPWTSERYPETTSDETHYPSSSQYPQTASSEGTGASEIHPGPTGPPPCHYYLAESSGEFHSPNYPYHYENNLSCYWTIAKPQNCSTLKFTAFSLENCGSCGCDRVMVTVGTLWNSYVLGPFCGRNGPSAIEFTDQVSIEFITDRSRTSYGFSAEYVPGCGLTEPTPVQSSSSPYPGSEASYQPSSEKYPQSTSEEMSWTTQKYPESTHEEMAATTHGYTHST